MPNFISEDELAKKFAPVEEDATPAGGPPPVNENPFFRGTISPVLQHDANLVRTQYKHSSGIPVRPLMPPNPGSGAQGNAGSTGVASNLIKPVQVQTNTNTSNITTNTNVIASLTATSFQGAWSNLVSYSQGASVDYSGSIYISLINGNLNNTPSSSPTDWQAAGGSNSSVFLGAWSSLTNYVIGNQVTFGTPSSYYIALSSSTNLQPNTHPANWQLISTTNTDLYEGAYNAGTAYVPGNFVSFTDGNFYVCISNTTGNAPSPTGSSFWTLLGSSAVLLGAYNAGTAYKAGMQVTSGGGVFTALQATTGNAPPTPPNSNSFWSYIGPSDLSIVPDSSSRFGQTASGLTYRPTSNPLTATDAGSNATVSIAAFTMRTSSKGDVSVNSGSVTALSYSTLYYIYYDDATLAGGGVTYAATTTKTTAIQGSGRFFVGSITTPAATGPTATGNNDGGVGAQAGQTSVFLFGATAITQSGANNPGVANPQNAIDGNLTTFAKLSVTFTSSEAESTTLTLSGASPTSAPWTSLTLNVRSSVPTNTTGTGTGNITFSIGYSLDGGSTFTTIYSVLGPTTRALTTDSIALPVTQNLALVRVQALMSRPTLNGNTGQQNIYEAWVVGLQ
jgi:hypothetical protein